MCKIKLIFRKHRNDKTSLFTFNKTVFYHLKLIFVLQ